MIDIVRDHFNKNFTAEKYHHLLQQIEHLAPNTMGFRIAETPVFIPASFKNKILATCEHIIDFIKDDQFKELTNNSIPQNIQIPGCDSFPQMMVFDFGICKNDLGIVEPQLIEMQGFPSVAGLQYYLDEFYRNTFEIPDDYSSYLNKFHQDKYIRLLKEIILGNSAPKNVILLEFMPEKQKTLIDFICLKKLLGIETVCITQVKSEGTELFYLKGERKIKIERIFNRLIFDDLKEDDWSNIIDLNKEYNVTWINHPEWYYRISKYCLPFLHHEYIPESYFLIDIKQPLPLNEYVLKPLFSYAGMGVIIDVTQKDIDEIKDPENWILQKKVDYAPIIQTPHEPAKAEIRIFYFWKDGEAQPIAVHNLARLSKEKMIGTRYNAEKDWVGGTIAYFEKEK